MNEQTNHIKSKIHKIKHIKRGTSVSAILHILTFKKKILHVWHTKLPLFSICIPK